MLGAIKLAKRNQRVALLRLADATRFSLGQEIGLVQSNK